MLYAGMDVHKKFCQIIVCTKEGEVIKKGKIRTNEKEMRMNGTNPSFIIFSHSFRAIFFISLLYLSFGDYIFNHIFHSFHSL